MNKKNLVIVCFGILLLSVLSSMISAQDVSGLSKEELQALNQITVVANPSKWGDFLNNFKAGILENPIIFGFNNLFIQLNIVFLILFGVDYSFSLSMFFVIVLWIFFLVQISGILRMTSIFSKPVSILISLGLTILLAQTRLYSVLANALFSNQWILSQSPFVGILLYVGIIILLVFLANVRNLVEKKMIKDKKLLEEEKAHLDRKILGTYVDEIKKEFDK